MIQTKIKGIEALKKDLAIIFLTKEDKKNIFKWTAGDIKKNATSNINKQQSPTGEKWKPRAKSSDFNGLEGKALRQAKKQAKMLKNRARWLGHEITGSYRAKLGYKILRTAQVSQIHQKGLVDDLPPDDRQKAEIKQWVKENIVAVKQGKGATAQQAARLKALGYNAPINEYKKTKKASKTPSKSEYAAIQRKWRDRIRDGKNRRSVTENEIMQSLTMGQAGLLIRLLDPNYDQKAYRDRYKARKKENALPQRPFLDTDDERNAERLTQVILRYQKTKK